MSIIDVPTHMFVDFCNRTAMRRENGQATAEYGVVILIAVALGMAVLMLFTKGTFNSVLGGMVERVLKMATTKIG